MKINNIKNNLKRASATVLASLCMCLNLHAKNKPECDYEKKENSSSVLGYVATAGVSSALTLGAVWVYNHFLGNRTETDLLYRIYKIYYDDATDEEEKKWLKALYDYWLYVQDHAVEKLKPIGESTTESTTRLEDTIEYKLFHDLDGEIDNIIIETYGKKQQSEYGYYIYNNDIQVRFTHYFIRSEVFKKECQFWRGFRNFIFDMSKTFDMIENFGNNFRSAIEKNLSYIGSVFIGSPNFKEYAKTESGFVFGFLKGNFNTNCQELVWFFKIFDTENIEKTIQERPKTLNGVRNFKEFVLFLIKNGKLKPAYQQYADCFEAETNKIN